MGRNLSEWEKAEMRQMPQSGWSVEALPLRNQGLVCHLCNLTNNNNNNIHWGLVTGDWGLGTGGPTTMKEVAN